MYTFLGIHFTRLWWLLWPLRFFIRPQLKPDNLTRDKILESHGDTDVIYVLPWMSVVDAFALNRLLKRNGLPRIRSEALPNRFRKAAILGVRAQPGIRGLVERKDGFTAYATRLLQQDKRVARGGLSLQPVSVFWSRGAERNERNFILKSLFPDDGSGNLLQKLLLLIVHGGVVQIHFGTPLVFSAEGAHAFAVRALQDSVPGGGGAPEAPGQLGDSAQVSVFGAGGSGDAGAEASSTAVSTELSTELSTGLSTGLAGAGASAGSQNEELLAKRFRRYLLIEFQRERTAALGPALYDVSTVANRILRSQETVKLISSMDNPQKQRKKALHYLDEIAAVYNYSTVRALEKLLDFIWTRIFKGVRVRNFEAIEKVARSGHILWMPCHRSHLDYLLLSYVLFKKGLVTPHIAAGVNLSFWPAGPVLRRGGAFYLRRSFSGNKLYASVFSQYVDFLMHNSFPVEFFHEGGRSRIGKLLSPKTGLTNICVASVLRRKAENTYIIPVYFSYDKVMEDDAYARELAGAKKQRESVWQLLTSVRYLFSNYGSVDVSFGTPLHFGEFWKTHFSGGAHFGSAADAKGLTLLSPDMQQLPEVVDPREPQVQSFVRALARRVNQGINAAASASGSALLASVVLASAEGALTEPVLRKRIGMLHWTINRLAKSLGWSIATATGAEVTDTDGFMLSEDPLHAQSRPPLPEGSAARARLALSEDAAVVSVPLAPIANLDKDIKEIIETAVQWQFVVWRRDAGEEPHVAKNPAKDMNMWWYRGTVFHILATVGVVASVWADLPSEELTLARIEAKASAVRAVWDEELFWPDSTSTAAIVHAALEVLSEVGALRLTRAGEPQRIETDEAKKTLTFFADLVRPERELYGLQVSSALALVETKGRFARDDVLRQAQATHRTAFLRGVASHPANLSHVFGARTFDALFRAGVFIPRDKQQLAVAFTEVVAVADFFELKYWKEFQA